MTDTNDERLTVAVRAHCFEVSGDVVCTYPGCGCTVRPEEAKRAVAALDAHDRAQVWGPEAREAMALDAAQALRGAQAARWAGGRSHVMAWDELLTHVQADLIANASAAVDAVLRHVRGPLPTEVTEGMVDVYIETMCLDRSPLNQQAIADLRVRVRIGLTAALAAAPKPDQVRPIELYLGQDELDDLLYGDGLSWTGIPGRPPIHAKFHGKVPPKAEDVTRLAETARALCGLEQRARDGANFNMAAVNKAVDALSGALAPFTGQATAPKPDQPSADNVTRLVGAAKDVVRALNNGSKFINGQWHSCVLSSNWRSLDAALAPFAEQADGSSPPSVSPPQRGEVPAAGVPAPPTECPTMADALKAIAAVGTGVAMKSQWDAIHTVLSTLVAEREAQARRDERVRAAAHGVRMAAEYMTGWHEWPRMTNALSALAATLVEDGR